ncbi:uncharacterized protein LOC144167550 [Haemaphysalis longicornis]
MSQNPSSGSSTDDWGDGDPFEVLEELRQKSLEITMQQTLALGNEMRTTRNEINQLNSSKAPEESDATGGREMPVPDVAECITLEMTDFCKRDNKIRGEVVTAKMRQQWAQSLLSSAAKFGEMCKAMARFVEDSDDEEELAGAQGTCGAISQGDPLEPDE